MPHPSRAGRAGRDPRRLCRRRDPRPRRGGRCCRPVCAPSAPRHSCCRGTPRHPAVGRGGPGRLHRRVAPRRRGVGSRRRHTAGRGGGRRSGRRRRVRARGAGRPCGERRRGSRAPTPTPWCPAVGCCGSSCGRSGARTSSSARPSRSVSSGAEALAAWHARHRLVEGHDVRARGQPRRAGRPLARGGSASGTAVVGEDVDLVERVRGVTDRWVATDTTRVLTSGRSTSRVDDGFAGYLRTLDAETG